MITADLICRLHDALHHPDPTAVEDALAAISDAVAPEPEPEPPAKPAVKSKG